MKDIEERERLINKMAAEQATYRFSQYNKSVSSSSDLKVKEFFNNLYLINMMCDCLEYGAKWADANPYLKWVKYNDRKPIECEEVLAFNKKWIDEDLNPNGTRVGFLNVDGEFTFRYMSDEQDYYENHADYYRKHIDNTEPEYWLYISDLIHHVINDDIKFKDRMNLSKEELEILQAFEEGRIEGYNKKTSNWSDLSSPDFTEPPTNYRIKPKL